MEKYVYLISPVRQVTEEQAAKIAQHSKKLQLEGVRLFNPVEDAPQEDPTGYGIVMSELGFMFKAAKEQGRVDILWNAGGKPSEGSRVDLGMALALDLEFNLVTIFNEDELSGTQLGLQLIKEVEIMDLENSPLLYNLLYELSVMKSSREITVNWDTEMITEEQEWQRLRLGLALGCLALDPHKKLKLGILKGEDPRNKKSYVKVIREVEKQGVNFPQIS